MPDVTARYGMSFDLIASFGYFYTLLTTIDVWNLASSPIFHRLYVWLMYTFRDIKIPNLTPGKGMLSHLMHFFFGNFHILLHIWNDKTLTNFYKLCICRTEKLILCNHLWFRQYNRLYTWLQYVILPCITAYYVSHEYRKIVEFSSKISTYFLKLIYVIVRAS